MPLLIGSLVDDIETNGVRLRNGQAFHPAFDFLQKNAIGEHHVATQARQPADDKVPIANLGILDCLGLTFLIGIVGNDSQKYFNKPLDGLLNKLITVRVIDDIQIELTTIYPFGVPGPDGVLVVVF